MGDRIAVLNAGIIQQLGAPRELYDTPANLFVAGFIGSPSMSFLSARLAPSDDGVAVAFDDSSATPLALGAGRSSRLEAGRTVIAGVRPEHLRLSGDGGAITGVVELVEHLGNEQLLQVSTPSALALEAAGQQREDSAVERPHVTARLDSAARVTPGERVSLALDPARLHLFDPDTGRRLA